MAALGVLATAILTAVTIVLVPVKYEANALIVLLPPNSTIGEGGNPFTELGGLDTAAGVLALALNTEDMANAVARTSSSASFTVEEDESTSGPVLRLTVEDRDPLITLQALDTLVTEAEPTFAKLQLAAGAPRDTLINVTPVTQESSTTLVRQGQIRSVLAVAAFGVILTGLIIAALDRRSRSRISSASDDADGPPKNRENRNGTARRTEPRTDLPLRDSDDAPTTALAAVPLAAMTRGGSPSPGPRPTPGRRGSTERPLLGRARTNGSEQA